MWWFFMKDMKSLGLKVLKQLNDAGYQAFFVGGYVRDQLLGMKSDDIDITTNALPEDIEGIFNHTVATGKKYGTITVFIDNTGFEVTTYRIDQDYKNHRQPESVKFSQKLKDDLIRRDFTMNALAQDKEGEIYDFFDGKTDIKNHIIRAIDDPDKRFKEDALRILRALRFVGKLGFDIEDKTLNAMKNDVGLLNKIPTERIIKELDQILSHNHTDKVYKLMNDIRLDKAFKSFAYVLPYIKNKDLSLPLESFFALSIYPKGKIDTSKWRFSNAQVTKIETLAYIMNLLMDSRLTRLICYNYEENMLLEADRLLDAFFDYQSQSDKIKHIYKHLVIKSYNDLNISGHDLKKLVDNDKQVGEILNQLIKEVLLEKTNNLKQDLLERAKQIMEEHSGRS
jgi:tRNA nucleotidyltransferase (CCA-adding enzyme)